MRSSSNSLRHGYDGLIEVQDTTVVKIRHKENAKPEPKQPHERQAGKAKLMRIFMGEADAGTENRCTMPSSSGFA